MKKEKTNFITHPSAKKLIVITSIWLLSVVLLTLAQTDLFTESIFQKKYIMSHFITILSVLGMVKLYLNYWKNKNGTSKL